MKIRYINKGINMSPLKKYGKIALYATVGVVAAMLIFSNLEAYSNYGNAILLALTAVFFLYSTDKWVLHGWDTIEEIKKGNIAAGLSLLAYAVLIGGCIIAAFVVYK